MSRVLTRIAALLLAATFGCRWDDAAPTSPTTSASTAVSLDAVPPNAPVIFLHYDYMVPPEGGQFPGDTVQTYAPDPAEIDRVVVAFRRHGITLVIDPQHAAIPSDEVAMGFGSCPLNRICADFFDLKSQYFKPKGQQSWHYAIFAAFGYIGGQRVGGGAEQEGYNLMVTVYPPRATCTFGTPVNHCADRQSSNLMHELGHNLGLRHGGDEDENYKPNYISVMNYAFFQGIPLGAPGDTYTFAPYFVASSFADLQRITSKKLDYSDGLLPPLDEQHLDERIGLGGSPANTSFSWFQGNGVVNCPDYDGRYNTLHAAAQPTDWNYNGQIESDVAVDVNWYWTWMLAGAPFPAFGVCPIYSVLHDYDDWSHVQRYLRTPAYVTGMSRSARIVADPPRP